MRLEDQRRSKTTMKMGGAIENMTYREEVFGPPLPLLNQQINTTATTTTTTMVIKLMTMRGITISKRTGIMTAWREYTGARERRRKVFMRKRKSSRRRRRRRRRVG